jgi:3-oxoacyl-[acyl-carrier-protein] synthase II
MFYARPERRVTITGCGLACPDRAAWEGFHAAPCREHDLGMPAANDARSRASGGAPDVDPTAQRCAELSARAAGRALEHAGLSPDAGARLRAGVVLGTSLGACQPPQRPLAGSDLPKLEDLLVSPAYRRLTWMIAQRIGVNGPVLLNAQACGTGSAALAWGYELIASGYADLMLAGGADSVSPRGCARPDDKGDASLDGAGILVLEELEHASARGARVLGGLAGYGLSHPVVDGPGATREDVVLAVQQALSTTHTQPEHVDCLLPNVVGAGAAPAAALREILGERVDHIQSHSVAASLLGESHGATSALDVIAWLLMLCHEERKSAETRPSPGSHRRSACAPTCLNLAGGFGSSYVCVVLKAH